MTHGPAILERQLVGFDVDGYKCKWTGAFLYVSIASDLFLQCKMHYISYTGVGIYVGRFTVCKDGDGIS